MPITLPAHAAAVLPFLRMKSLRLHTTALVVGAATPDLAYLGEGGKFSHTLFGLFAFCLPVGMLALLYAEALMLPALRHGLPDAFGVNFARLARSEGLPSDALGWGRASCALLVGAITHVLWDGFTHRGMMPAELYQDVRFGLFGFSMTAPRWAQHLSSLFGSLFVLGYLVKRYGREDAAAPGSRRDFYTLLVPTLSLALLAMVWRLQTPLWGGTLYTKLWKLFWPMASFALAGFSFAALRVCYRKRIGAAARSPSKPPP